MPVRTRSIPEDDGLGTMQELRDKAESSIVEERLVYFKYRLKYVAASLDISLVHLHNLRRKHNLMA